MLAELKPVIAAHVAKMHYLKSISEANILAEVIYEDGSKDTMEMDNDAIVAELLKAKPELLKANGTPTNGEAKGKGRGKAKGTPSNGEAKEKEKTKVIGRWLNMDDWIGVCDYHFKTTGWKEVAILADEGDTYKVALFFDTQYGRAVAPHMRRMHPRKGDTNQIRNVRLWKPKKQAA